MNIATDQQQGLDTVHLDLPASHKYLNMIAPCIAEMLTRAEGLDDVDNVVYGVQLAVQEVCTNIVDHAYAGQPGARIIVALTLEAGNRRLLAEFRDTGHSFDPTSIAEPDLENGQVHGYGLFLIRELMDHFTYTPLPDGNRWQLEKRW